MKEEIDNFSSKFSAMLEPIKCLLEFKRMALSTDDWIVFLEKVKSSIIKNPEQYLGKDLPNGYVIKLCIDKIFDEILEREQASLGSKRYSHLNNA